MEESPSTLITDDLSNPLLQSIEDIYKEHGLPPILYTMHEIDRMGLAYAFEARKIVQDEVNSAERRYRQILIVARIYHVHFLEAQERLQHMQRELDALVEAAVKKAAEPNPGPGGQRKSPSCKY
jgi:hypothetical protein